MSLFYMSFTMISTSVHFPVDVTILFFMSELNFIVDGGGRDRQSLILSPHVLLGTWTDS